MSKDIVFTLKRHGEKGNATLGALFSPDNKFLCWTLEDIASRGKKVYGRTRIGADLYEIVARRHGGWFKRAQKEFGDDGFHPFMLELANVRGFKHILIHWGNTHEDTAGCILVGANKGVNDEGDYVIWNSKPAYQRVYPIIRDAMREGDVYLDVVNESPPRRFGDHRSFP